MNPFTADAFGVRLPAMFPRETALALLLCLVAACGDKATADRLPDASTPKVEPAAVVPPAPPKADPLKELLDQPNLSAAIGYTKKDTTDNVNGKQSIGEQSLIVWAAKHGIRWDELQAIPETKVSLVLKDSDEQRGKRLCAAGAIIEIAAVKTQVGKYFDGGLVTDSQEIIRFHAFGSTGELVAQSPARICGVVTGRADYQNSVGGVAHGVQIVGAFDLPENKKKPAPVGSK